MLEALMNFGGYRVDRFTRPEKTNEEFGLYICTRGGNAGGYCAEAKHQLYYGLALLYSHNVLRNLAGIYIDINNLENLQRPAYLELKRDIQANLFQRVLMTEVEALLANAVAEKDMHAFARQIEGFELMTFVEGEIAVQSFHD